MLLPGTNEREVSMTLEVKFCLDILPLLDTIRVVVAVEGPDSTLLLIVVDKELDDAELTSSYAQIAASALALELLGVLLVVVHSEIERDRQLYVVQEGREKEHLGGM